MSKTLIEKRDAALALAAKYDAQINAEAILNNIGKGNDVEFTFGRAEKKRTLRGVVAGIRDDEKQGRLVAIVVTGDDEFDTQTYKVRVADVTRNFTAEETADEAPAADGSDASDPLAND